MGVFLLVAGIKYLLVLLLDTRYLLQKLMGVMGISNNISLSLHRKPNFTSYEKQPTITSYNSLKI